MWPSARAASSGSNDRDVQTKPLLTTPAVSSEPTSPEAPAVPSPLGSRGTRLLRFLSGVAIVAGVLLACGAIAYEAHTSAIQSYLLSEYARHLTYEVGSGPSPRIVFPENGPFDYRRGYSQLPDFEKRLAALGFQVERQTRQSRQLAALLEAGIPPPYREPSATGLVIRGVDGALLYDGVKSERLFQQFDDVPYLLTYTLLFMEDRQLLSPADPRTNPVIEWDRLAKASLTFAGRKLGLPFSLEGGSTLATQLEKYRHSPLGRTKSGLDKLRQMAAASLKVYRDGPDTRMRRHEIVVDYLNTLPLAGAPGYGEVYGLGNGLYAWFGLELSAVRQALNSQEMTPAKVHAYKHVLALLASLRSPATYLISDRDGLNARVDEYTDLLAKAGVIDTSFAEALHATPIVFLDRSPAPPPTSFVDQKAPNAIRNSLVQWLGVPSLYELDHLHLQVRSTIDASLQSKISALLRNLAEPSFIKANGLTGERLLQSSDPKDVIYSVLLFERAPEGNVLRIQADNLDRPFDMNEGVKLELGSTAKLRTLAHYLEIIAMLYREMLPLNAAALRQRLGDARDPITRWVATQLSQSPAIELSALLDEAMERRYSASPYEQFFTGGGLHSFENFDPIDNGRILSLKVALQNSVNLVFIRLMRDLVRYHEARLPYDVKEVLTDFDSPMRRQMLEEMAESETRLHLWRSYRRYAGLQPEEIADRLLRSKATSPRHRAILYLAWHRGATIADLGRYLHSRFDDLTNEEVVKLWHAYDNPRLTLADWGYLLSRHPVELWAAGELIQHPHLDFEELVARADPARQVVGRWLMKTRNRSSQNTRLRIQIEKDAFARMTPYWQRLGFPFRHLLASYATAIGSSSDRPAALAELMGIIVNGGLRRPEVRMTQLHFAKGTPYETVFTPEPHRGERVMEPEVAETLRAALTRVVAAGTGRRVYDAFVGPDGKPVVVGGKTGSGDNRYSKFNRWGGVISSHAINRTATFVFYIGDRYFGVVTAIVPGREADKYHFTSALALAVLKLSAPAINTRLRVPPSKEPSDDSPARVEQIASSAPPPIH